MAIPNEIFSAALANNLTPSAITTWNPNIARSPRVLVPIEVTALAVRAETPNWADCKMSAPPKGDPGNLTPGVDLLPEPFKNLDAPRPTGIYLHWALPDALTQGSISATNPDVSFPAIPDRWLVVRLSSGAITSRRAVAGWVLDTGGETPVVTPIATFKDPVNPDDPPPLDVLKPLTALGHGDPFWSAYFDNVENRLGFHDPLTNVAGPIAYLVCGWHSRHADDPIGEGLRTYSQFEARLTQLGWEIPSADLEKAFQSSSDTVRAAALSGVDTREARFTSSAQTLAVPAANASFFTQKLTTFQGVANSQAAAVDKFGAAEAGRVSRPPGILAGLHSVSRRGGRHRLARHRHRRGPQRTARRTGRRTASRFQREGQHRQHDGRSARRHAGRQQRVAGRLAPVGSRTPRLHAGPRPARWRRADRRAPARHRLRLASRRRHHHDHPPAPIRHRAALRSRSQTHRPRRIQEPATQEDRPHQRARAERTRSSAWSAPPTGGPIKKSAPPAILAGSMEAAIDWAATRNSTVARTLPSPVDPDPDPVETTVKRVPAPLLHSARSGHPHTGRQPIFQARRRQPLLRERTASAAALPAAPSRASRRAPPPSCPTPAPSRAPTYWIAASPTAASRPSAKRCSKSSRCSTPARPTSPCWRPPAARRPSARPTQTSSRRPMQSSRWSPSSAAIPAATPRPSPLSAASPARCRPPRRSIRPSRRGFPCTSIGTWTTSRPPAASTTGF